MLKINILTIFPEYFSTTLKISMLGRAQHKKMVKFRIINIRDFAHDKHQATDDRPFGGGPGMIMKVEPIYKALNSLGQTTQKAGVVRILTSAQGQSFSQKKAQELAGLSEITVICGHYQGIDERVSQHLVDQEIRIGNYVLTGGEPAALVMVDAVTRLVPGVLGNPESNLDESHSSPDELGFPQYTRPAKFKGWKVPSVLLEGDHKLITDWRKSAKKSV